MKLSCEFHYDSAHYLPMVPVGHKCGRLHGHTYRLIVTLDGPVRDDGFVVDFATIKADVKHWLAEVDHHLLNDVEGLSNPTVELQLHWWHERLKFTPFLHSLTIYEGLNNSATFEVLS